MTQSTPIQASPRVALKTIAKASSTSTDIGIRGLVIVTGSGSFAIVPEDNWRELASFSVSDQVGDLKSLATLKVSLALLESSVFVDLDQLKDLGGTDGSRGAAGKEPDKKTALAIPSGTALILKEGNKLYPIPQSLLEDIPGEITGDAAVLVNRKAVLAPIPTSKIASGTFCVLINFSGIEGAP